MSLPSHRKDICRVEYQTSHVTQAFINLDHLTHNVHLLQELVGNRQLWPAIKAHAYGHDAILVGRHLVSIGYTTLCVAHVAEAAALVDASVEAICIVLSATLPEHSDALVAYGCEPVVCTLAMVDSLAQAAATAGTRVGRTSQSRYGYGCFGA